MNEHEHKALRWHASTAFPAGKAAVVLMHWDSCYDHPPGAQLQEALNSLRFGVRTHPSTQPAPDVPLASAHHPEAIPLGQNGPYRTLWFDRELSQEEREGIGRAYALVEAKLNP